MHRLVYFAVPGRGEASRVALAFSDLEWEDVRIQCSVGNDTYIADTDDEDEESEESDSDDTIGTCSKS